eukprot:scaffold322338_cov19-Prasinocladus_malaysianus.AAC.1
MSRRPSNLSWTCLRSGRFASLSVQRLSVAVAQGDCVLTVYIRHAQAQHSVKLRKKKASHRRQDGAPPLQVNDAHFSPRRGGHAHTHTRHQTHA